MKKERIIRASLRAAVTGLILSGVYEIKNIHHHRSISQEYRQEFKTEVTHFSERIKNRKFPNNAEAEQAINLSLLVDAEFKRGQGDWLFEEKDGEWQKSIEDAIGSMSKRFYEEFGIGFQVAEVRYWDTAGKSSLPELLYDTMKAKTETFGTIGLTGKSFGSLVEGISTTPEFSILKAHSAITIGGSIPFENLLQHEISHWFNAKDLDTKNITCYNSITSIMSYCTVSSTNQWDMANESTMKPAITLTIDIIQLQKTLKTKQE